MRIPKIISPVNKYIVERLVYPVFAIIILSVACDEKKEDFAVKGDTESKSFFYELRGDKINEIPTLLKSHLEKSPEKIILGITNWSWPAKITFPNKAETKVEISIDKDALQAYNKANKTSCILIPEAGVQLSSTTLTIPSGMYVSDTLKISLNPSGLGDFNEPDYLLPIKIINTSVGTVSSNYNTIFIRINNQVTNCYDFSNRKDIKGERIVDRSTWKAQFIQAGKSKSVDGLLDENISTTTWEDLSSVIFPTELIVDMQQAIKNISAIRLTPNDFTNESGLSDTQVFSSEDGENWNSQGQISIQKADDDKPNSYIRFYTPFTARYLKLKILNASGSFMSLSEWDTYIIN